MFYTHFNGYKDVIAKKSGIEMAILKKLPGYRRTPYGKEVKILKLIPRAFFWSTLIIGIFVAVGHLLPPDGSQQDVYKHLDMINILGIAFLITAWTAIFTVAVGAFVVYIMKGPAYVADPLEVVDSDKPKG